MAASVLPFDAPKGHNHPKGAKNCSMFKMLPPALQHEVQENEFLLDYIHLIPIEEVGVPEFYEELDRELGEKKNPNLIYRIGGGIFVHIYPDPSDSRDQ